MDPLHLASPAVSADRASRGSLEIRFVGTDEDEAKTSKPIRPPKAAHKKSRNGCRRCRTRRVKCDEVHPVCSNCRRYHEICSFQQNDGSGNDAESSTSQQRRSIDERGTTRARGLRVAYQPTPIQAQPVTNSGVVESSPRRLLELKLMHTYYTQTSPATVFDGDPVATKAFIQDAPALAFTNNALLYAILAYTALWTAESDASSASHMMFIYHNYWDMALQEHKQDVANICVKNFDAICITSTFIRLIALVMLKARSLVPYTSPMEWYQLTSGAMQTFVAAHQWRPQNIRENEPSISSRLTDRMPFVFDEAAKFGISNRRDFLYLLEPIGDDDSATSGGLIPAVDQIALEKTVSYIGGIWITLSNAGGDSGVLAEVARRLIIMPHLVPSRFAELIQQQHMRALVVLAHYFAMLYRFRHVWYIGSSGEREVRAIAAFISPLWQPLMRWPLEMVVDQDL